MKVILFMAQTINGLIARNNYSEDFLSDNGWVEFKALSEKAGCFVYGRKTFELISKLPDADFLKFKTKCIVLSSSKEFIPPKGVLVANSPKDVFRIAKEQGCKEIILTGGGMTNSAFMKQNLVDEIILNIDPFVLGSGVRIFAEEDFENKLKLLKIRKLLGGTLQLHYKVIK